jgi:hypothetical protein
MTTVQLQSNPISARSNEDAMATNALNVGTCPGDTVLLLLYLYLLGSQGVHTID